MFTLPVIETPRRQINLCACHVCINIIKCTIKFSTQAAVMQSSSTFSVVRFVMDVLRRRKLDSRKFFFIDFHIALRQCLTVEKDLRNVSFLNTFRTFCHDRSTKEKSIFYSMLIDNRV